MAEFANKSSLVFLGANRLCDAIGVAFSAEPIQLDDLARLTYIKGRLRGCVDFGGSDVTGAVDLVLRKNGVEFKRYSKSIAVKKQVNFNEVVGGMGAMYGDDQLTVDFEVMTAFDAGAIGTLSACLDVEHPLVIAA